MKTNPNIKGRNQLIEDVNELEIEQKPVPESLERDLKRASQGLDDDKIIDEALESIADRIEKTGTSSLPEERVSQLDGFNHRGFFIQVFGLNGNFYGWAKETHPLIIDNRITFEALDMPSAFGCGQRLVNLVNTYHKRRYN